MPANKDELYSIESYRVFIMIDVMVLIISSQPVHYHGVSGSDSNFSQQIEIRNDIEERILQYYDPKVENSSL